LWHIDDLDWYAPREISTLIAPFPDKLSKYCPQLQYLLMDERHDYSDEQLSEKLNNLVAVLFRLEKSRSKPETQQALKVLRQWLIKAPPSLRTAFRTWFRRVKLPRHLPETVLSEFNDLQEIENMLANTAENWLEQSKQEGRKEGRKEGLKDGKLTILINLLEERFGSLNAETKATLHSLNETKLLECAKRLFTAKTLQDVIKQ
jgi:flagellar biosynthesis/type III secretory pathway protein FliH